MEFIGLMEPSGLEGDGCFPEGDAAAAASAIPALRFDEQSPHAFVAPALWDSTSPAL